MSAAETREAILAVSARLFATHGIGGTTMRAIAAGCSIKAASLYHHFASKDEIVAEVMGRSSDFASGVFAEIRATELGPAERVEALMRATVECYLAHPEASRAYHENAEYVGAAPLLRPSRVAAAVITRQWVDAIADGIAAGVVRADVDPTELWELLRDMLLALSRLGDSERVNRGVDVLLRGVSTAGG